MPRFQVTPEAVSDVASRLGGISAGVEDLHAGMGAHASAAMATPVDGALAGLMGHWAQVLPVFALAGDRLSAAVAGAAIAYRTSDAAVGDAAAREAG